MFAYRYIVSLLVALWSFQLAAEEPVVLIVGLEKQPYAPYHYYRDGVPHGYAKEVIDAFAEYSGYRVEYRAFSINELFHQLISRQIDFKYPDNPYWQHPLKSGVRIAYSDPVAPYVDGVTMSVSRKGTGLKQLNRLGILSGFTPLNYQYLSDNGQLSLIEKDSLVQLFEAFFKGEIDGVYGNVDVVLALAKSKYSDRGELFWNQRLPYVAQFYRVSTASKPRLLKVFDQFLLENAEQMKQLREKYQIFGVEHRR